MGRGPTGLLQCSVLTKHTCIWHVFSWQEAHLWEEVLVVRSFPSSPYFNVLGDDSLVVGTALREVHKAWWTNKDIQYSL